MNLFGVDVSGLDAEAFLTSARNLYPVFALAWLALVAWRRRPGWLLAFVVLSNAYAWLETNWPLQRLYALGPSSDRINNLALCQVVAAGHTPLHTPQTGQMHFEPFWAVMTALVSWWDPERLLRLYPFLPLLAAAGFAVSLFFALRPWGAGGRSAGGDTEERPWSGWERAIVALFATLLSSAALDYASPYRVPWAMTFLLKPNHAVGLLLFPWVLRSFARISGWRGRIATGVLLHVLGWAFVIHMGAVCVGLVTYAVLATLRRGEEARPAWLDVAAVIGINLLVVSPYLVMLFRGYGVFHSGPRMEIPPASPHLLEALGRLAPLTALAVHGLGVAWRRDRLGRVWVGQALAALLLWLSYYPLSLFQQAKERDDVYYWLRVQLAVCAALGAWDLARRAAPLLWPRAMAAPRRAVLVSALSVPFLLPYWWDPSRMDLYFRGSLPPLPAELTAPAEYFRGESASRPLLAGDMAAARWMAALAGTRVLLARDMAVPSDHAARAAVTVALVRGEPGDPAGAAARFGVTHLVITPELLASLGVPLDDLDRRPYLQRVLLEGTPTRYMAVFAVAPPAS